MQAGQIRFGFDLIAATSPAVNRRPHAGHSALGVLMQPSSRGKRLHNPLAITGAKFSAKDSFA